MVNKDDFYDTIVYLVALWLGIVVVIVYITKGTRRIPIQYAKLTRGRRVYGGQRHYLPLKVNMAGVMPIIFASIVFVLPGVLFSLLNYEWSNWLAEVFNDQVLATAILDRLLHHATTVNIKGDSYRLREKKKAGLLGRKPKPVDAEEAGVPA